MKKQAEGFGSVTVFILATNETYSLEQTVYEIQNLSCVDDIEKLIIVLKNKHCVSYDVAKQIADMYEKPKIEIYLQKAKDIEGCIAELPLMAKSTHFIIMVADGEMDPANVDAFIDKAKKHPERIICASKWHEQSEVKDYGNFKKIATRAMNTFISAIFNVKITDPFSIYQIYPTSVYKKLKFNNPRTFVYEYTVKALRNNIEYEEIPTVYNKRNAGKSHFKYIKLFQTAIFFCITAIKLRIMPKSISNSQKTRR